MVEGCLCWLFSHRNRLCLGHHQSREGLVGVVGVQRSLLWLVVGEVPTHQGLPLPSLRITARLLMVVNVDPHKSFWNLHA